MQVRRILTAVAFAATSLASTCGFAGTIDITFAGSANFGAGGVGYYSGQVAPSPSSTTALTSVGIGGDSFTTANKTYDFSKTGQFNAWCVDILHWLNQSTSNSTTYTVYNGTAQLAADLDALTTGLSSHLNTGNNSGANRVAALTKLANQFYKQVDTEVESAAFQLAVWAITFGSADSNGKFVVNTTNTGFKVDSATDTSAYGQLADTWLAALGSTPNTGNYVIRYLSVGTNSQDLIVFAEVPEPGSLALLALALMAIAYVQRKRSQQV
jgi:hypothetical protein